VLFITVIVDALTDKVVEAIKMPFQDALSHGGWHSAPRIGSGGAQGHSTAGLMLRNGLVCCKSQSNSERTRKRVGKFMGQRGGLSF
jgi:hypothetical protein